MPASRWSIRVFLFLFPFLSAWGPANGSDSATVPPSGFFVQAGGAFTSDNFLIPGTGRPLFGGSLAAGYTPKVLVMSSQILVSGGCTWAGANPALLAGDSPKLALIDARISFQSSSVYTEGAGFRLNLGLQRVQAAPVIHESRKIIPLSSVAIIAQRPSGPYLFLEFGLQAVLLGLGWYL